MAVIGVALARNADNAKRIILSFSCANTVAVGDLVYQDTTNDSFVITATNNTEVSQIIGVVYSKSTPFDANVMIIGVFDGFSGLSAGARIFLGANGLPTITKPTTGYVHNLGVAISATEALIIPNNIRVKLA